MCYFLLPSGSDSVLSLLPSGSDSLSPAAEQCRQAVTMCFSYSQAVTVCSFPPLPSGSVFFCFFEHLSYAAG